ncbi:phage terminase large subunit family protein [Paenibacillus hubeiensis]|uniref:phage terminase large subunit family protein n=1 Tax=Paenibacillus hubeiensis TaxID=3077330 RepID=UPI0031BAB264
MNAQRRQTFALLKRAVALVQPPEPLSVAEWADRHRVLSPEDSAEPGPWKTSRSPFQKEPMEAISDPNIERIIMMWGAQLGKTAIQLNAIGYFTGHDPAPIMVVQPDLVVAKDFSNDRLAPMYRDSPQLSKLVTKDKSRDTRNTILYKSYPGGRINIAGANSPASLASKPIRVLIADEIDRFPVSAGKEGDPVDLASKRTTTFYNKKLILVSTPTVKGVSRIESLYEDSTQESLYLPCPKCGELQVLKFENLKYDYDEETKSCTDVRYHCCECGMPSGEHEWKHDYENKAVWIAAKQHAKCRGFHLSSLYATINYTWKDFVNEWKEANRGGPEMIKAFVNTRLAETWEEKGDKLEHEELLNRRQMYIARVPEGVRFLTAAVDTQDNRFEIDVVGWGKGFAAWRIQFHKVFGDLNQEQVWHDLDEFLARTWSDAEGRKFRINRTFIDSGGHFTNQVYKFCKQRAGRGIYAIKGEGTDDGTKLPLIIGTSDNNIHRATVFRLGVAEGKARVFAAMKVKPGEPGYWRFPLPDPEKPDPFTYDEEYFKQLASEELVTRKKNGVAYQVWKQIRARNEALDLAVYNLAAIESGNPNFDSPLPSPGNVVAGATPQAQRRKRKQNVSSSV